MYIKKKMGDPLMNTVSKGDDQVKKMNASHPKTWRRSAIAAGVCSIIGVAAYNRCSPANGT